MYNTAMKNFRLHALPLLLALFLLPASASCETRADSQGQVAPPKSILFAGNSFTFYNNAIYTHLRKLLVADDPSTREEIFLKSMTISGAVLADHRGGLQQMLENRAYDVVVLQGHSREAIEPGMQAAFQAALEELSGKVRARGAEPVLFMTWAYADRPEMTAKLVSAYTRLGEKFEMKVVPVGLAFEAASQRLEGVVLHDPDKVHPSLAGTYLAAGVFYSALYGKSPLELEYDAGLDKELARGLRQVAWQTVRDFGRETTR